MADSVTFRTAAQDFFRQLYNEYIYKIGDAVRKDPELLTSVAGFLVSPNRVVLYFCKTHIIVEYEGQDRCDQIPNDDGVIELQAFDYADFGPEVIDEIIGFSFKSGTSGFRMPLMTVFEDLILPTNRGMNKLLKLGWNLSAQDSVLAFNASGLGLVEGKFARIINGFFFDASKKGLITRHIKWADCFPIRRMDDGETWKIGYRIDLFGQMAEQDARYHFHVSKEFRGEKLQRINRFIRNGSDTPKLASAWMDGRVRDGKSLYPQGAQCVGTDISPGLWGEVSASGDE